MNNVEGRPVIFYLHPWEIDPEQPMLRTSVLGTFRHYRNLALTESRLRRLLQEFEFGPMLNIVGALDPISADVKELRGRPYVW